MQRRHPARVSFLHGKRPISVIDIGLMLIGQLILLAGSAINREVL